MQPLLTVDQLAAILHKSPASIRSDASRKPSSLPPICRLPGNKRLLWRQNDVDTWLAQFAALSIQQAAIQVASAVITAKRRGRPTKKEQVARERLVASPSTPARAGSIHLPHSVGTHSITH